MPDSDFRVRYYRRSVRASFFLVLFLVLVGGIVRSSGSGMGCPDWPRCFGSWVPPTSIEQIPHSYYSNPLSSKNGILVFNVYKTWTEYINRLIGVLIGFSLGIQLILSFWSGVSLKSKVFSICAFVLVLFEGWLGAKVVSTDLLPLVITIHLIGALVIGLSLVSALHFSLEPNYLNVSTKVKLFSIFVLFILLLQFLMGTKVRSQVDVLFKKYDFGMRHLYIDHLDLWFYIHRSYSIFIFIVLIFQFLVLGKYVYENFKLFLLAPLAICIVIVLSGIFLNYFDFPAFAQPIHLTMGYAILCSQLWILLRLNILTKRAHGFG